jgi:hypothetical protein
MRKVLFPALLVLPLFAEVEYKGNLGFEVDYFEHSLQDKRDNALALRGEFEVKKTAGEGEFKLKLKGVWDKDDQERRYVDFSEFYYKYNFEDSELLLGRNTLFWGALEVYNLVDVFNTKDALDDPFDYDKKLGVWNISWTRFFDNSEFSLLLRLKEEDQKFQESASVFNFLPLPYNSDLMLQYDNRPSLFVRYSGSGEEIQIDYAFMYEAGYDNQRYFSYEYESGKLRQYAYWVNKLMAYTTLILEDTIYKAEGAYALSDDVKVSDYLHVGLGLEHTLYGIWEKKDLGLLAEYYGYYQFNDTKFSARELGVLFQNDLYFGGRFSFNDTAGSEILAGVDFDLDNHEEIYFLKYDTRVLDKFKTEFQYQHLSPKANSLFHELDHIKLAVSYYF